MKGLSLKTGLSLAQIVAQLVKDEQDLILGGVDMDQLLYDWNYWGRPKQIPGVGDPDDWEMYAMVMGRGGGKTRAGAEWVSRVAMEHPKCRIHLVARRAADIRDVLIEGESGILNVGLPENRPEYFKTQRRLVWPNGSWAIGFSAEEPDQLRGPQSHFAWADEVAAWKHSVDDAGATAWDNMLLANRLGDFGEPQAFVTTTPKRIQFMRDLLAEADHDEKIIIIRGSTMENAANLAPGYLKKMLKKYEGNPLGQQELYGLMLDTVEGALWDMENLNANRGFYQLGKEPKPALKIIAVDPTVAEDPGDECGIIVAGSTNHKRLSDRQAWVLEDWSMTGNPDEWATQVIECWKQHQCPVVVETNQGGSMAETILHGREPDMTILSVRGGRTTGKKVRAEPVVAKYREGKVHHVNYLPELEDQMLGWVPEQTKKSPDRVDALVYAITALIIRMPDRFGAGKLRARAVNSRLPGF